MKMLTMVGAATIIALASTAVAQQPASAPEATAAGSTAAPAPVAVKKADPQDRVICKTEEVIGSRLGGHRTCMTKRQWDEAAASSRDAMNHAQSSAGFMVPPSH